VEEAMQSPADLAAWLADPALPPRERAHASGVAHTDLTSTMTGPR
jgi:hypothetical protein